MGVVFKDFDEATLALLLSTCAVLNNRIEYVIAGGWVPILRGSLDRIKHPGTRDVDVLFNDDKVKIREAALQLLNVGFLPSAKHEFQLLRRMTVGARNFVFNIDLMHPSEQRMDPSLFEDIFDLGISDAYDPTGKRHLKSIAFPSAAIVFEQKLWSSITISGRDIEGQMTTQQVSLLTEEGFVLSKVESVQNPKRTRELV